MDGAVPVAIEEDGAENQPRNRDRTSENIVAPSAEDTADRVGVFCCQDCGEAFREEAVYLEHRHQHLQENVYLDDQLGGLHDAEKNSETAHFCTLCSVSFVELSEFHSHMEKNHGQSSQNESGIQMNSGITKQPTYECPDCGKCYIVIGHFLNHQRSHRQASKSVFHDLEHLKKKSFQCESCGRNYSRASALDAHRRCHEEKLVKSRTRSSGESPPTEESIVEANPSENQTVKCTVACQECGLKFTCCEDFETHLQQHAVEEEEEEEAETGDCRKPAAELVSGRNDRENGDENTDGSGCDMSSSLQSKPLELIQGDGVPTDSMKNNLRKFYTCLVCGKIYSYLVSFRKHQQLHENHPSAPKSIQTLNKYECPECGMSFVRRTRLLGHLRVHRSHKPFRSKPPRCDQCNKTFTSVKAWLSHTEVHKEKPFWCLVCAKGFRDEGSLDGHLQGHSLRQHKCDICHRRFKTSSHLVNHSNTHTGAKPHQCSFCGKSFAQPGNLIGHRNRYHRFHVGSKRRSLGIKNSAIMAKKGRIKMKMLTSVKEEPDMNTHMDEQPGKEKSAEESERQQPCEDAEFGDQDKSEESDCGEPMHDFKLSHPPTSTRSDPSKSETTQPQARQELDKSDLQETHVHRKHKYWEWECFECDMGFDDVAMLHLHYIKHATGELPFPQDVTEG